MLDLLNFTSEYRISKVLIGSLNSGYHLIFRVNFCGNAVTAAKLQRPILSGFKEIKESNYFIRTCWIRDWWQPTQRLPSHIQRALLEKFQINEGKKKNHLNGHDHERSFRRSVNHI